MINPDIKTFIINERVMNNTSFQDIALKIKEIYGQTMSRQAVYAIFRRATSTDNQVRSFELISLTNDILNYKALGCSILSISELTGETEYTIRGIIDRNEDDLNKIKAKHRMLVQSCMNTDMSFESIKNKLAYNGYVPSDKVVLEIIKENVSETIRNSIKATLLGVRLVVNDNKFIRSIANEYNVDITTSEINKFLNGV